MSNLKIYKGNNSDFKAGHTFHITLIKESNSHIINYIVKAKNMTITYSVRQFIFWGLDKGKTSLRKVWVAIKIGSRVNGKNFITSKMYSMFEYGQHNNSRRNSFNITGCFSQMQVPLNLENWGTGARKVLDLNGVNQLSNNGELVYTSVIKAIHIYPALTMTEGMSNDDPFYDYDKSLYFLNNGDGFNLDKPIQHFPMENHFSGFVRINKNPDVNNQIKDFKSSYRNKGEWNDMYSVQGHLFYDLYDNEGCPVIVDVFTAKLASEFNEQCNDGDLFHITGNIRVSYGNSNNCKVIYRINVGLFLPMKIINSNFNVDNSNTESMVPPKFDTMSADNYIPKESSTDDLENLMNNDSLDKMQSSGVILSDSSSDETEEPVDNELGPDFGN